MHNRFFPLHRLILILAIVTISLITPLIVSRAQSGDIILKVGFPDYYNYMVDDVVIHDFEAAHPGIKIQAVPLNAPEIRTYTSLDDFFARYRTYASSADVLYIETVQTPWIAFRAGYFLDLAPLVKADNTLNTDDFWPAVWQSVQWENGIWFLPTGADVLVVRYSASAFDQAGLAYPDEHWTKADFEKAIIALTEKSKKTGKIKLSGFSSNPQIRDLPLLTSLSGGITLDTSVLPNVPHLDSPDLESTLDWWVKLSQDGYVGDYNMRQTPLSVWPTGYLTSGGEDDSFRTAVLLPGGKSGLSAMGFGISAGTQHPQEAYQLASFLTTCPETSTGLITMPARKSVVGKPTKFGDAPSTRLPQTMVADITRVLENGAPVADTRYTEYLYFAFDKMMNEHADAKTALLAAEDLAIKDIQTADMLKSKQPAIAVATSVPVVSLPASKIEMKFGLMPSVMPLPNQDRWDQLIADFVATDPQVGKLDLDVDTTGQFEKMAQNHDCFYLPYNFVPSMYPGAILSLDPFLDADKAFDKADLLGGVLPQIQRDNKTWALPVAIQPAILKYDAAKLSKVGITVPVSGWVVDSFIDALKTLKPDPDSPAAFDGGRVGGASLLLIMAAEGALPIDYRTSPPTINFTDPATVEAIRQVLDLAKQGYLKYEPLTGTTGGLTFSTPANIPISTELLTPDTLKTPNVSLYPRGSKYAALSYTLRTGYISATAQSPEACYRWLTTLASHPELFDAMPARRSLLHDPALAASQGKETVAFYSQIDALLQDPNTVVIPSPLGGMSSPTALLEQRWLFKAFDAYVLTGADLDAPLKDAEQMTKGFQECVAGLPASSNNVSRMQQVYTCAKKVDPAMQ